MREGTPFGVIPIRSGAEVGGVVETAELGTTARIVDFSKLPDGLLGITCKGERKFRMLKLWQQPDGLNVGEIEYLPVEDPRELPDEYHHLGDLLRKVLPELGEPYASMAGNFADASWVSARLAEILPVSAADKVSLLELDEPLARLARLNRIVRRVPN
jgi:Lon protease-like protein